MQEIGGAIERVDNPDGVGFALYATFFGENRVIGIVFQDAIDDGLLGRQIGFTDEIVAAFLLDPELFKINHLLDECAASTSCRHHRYIE